MRELATYLSVTFYLVWMIGQGVTGILALCDQAEATLHDTR